MQLYIQVSIYRKGINTLWYSNPFQEKKKKKNTGQASNGRLVRNFTVKKLIQFKISVKARKICNFTKGGKYRNMLKKKSKYYYIRI